MLWKSWSRPRTTRRKPSLRSRPGSEDLKKSLGGLGKVAGLAALGSSLTAVASPLGGLTLAIGAFGALAAPTFSKVEKAVTSTGKAGEKAWAQLDPTQRGIAKAVEGIKTSFEQAAKAIEPMLLSLTKLGGKILSDVMPALQTLAKDGGKALQNLLTPLDGLVKSPFFKTFADTMGKLGVQASKVLGPALVSLLKVFMQLFMDVGPAGIKILQALLPAFVQLAKDLVPVVTAIADLVANTVTWLQKNKLLVPAILAVAAGMVAWKVIKVITGMMELWTLATTEGTAAARLLAFAMDALPWVALAATVAIAVALIIKYHTQIWDFIKKVWNDVYGFIKSTWNNILSFAKAWWPLLLGPSGLIIKYHNDIWNFIKDIWNKILSFFKSVWGDIRSAVTSAANGVKSFLSSAWNQMFTTVKNVWGNVVSFFKGMPSRLINALTGLGHGLAAFARAAFEEMLTAFKNVAGDILGWLGGFVKSIIGLVHKIIQGDDGKSKVFQAIGKDMMMGLEKGIRDNAHKAANAAKAAAQAASTKAFSGKFGAGVAQWKPDVLKVLAMLGLPSTLAGRVLYQMQTESGGNPNAINLTDSNAAAGDPSRGLLQTIMTTFEAYRSWSLPNNIYNPLANIYAAVNYAEHTYGKTLMRNGMGMGSGHGYASGGATSAGMAMVGEYGRELVRLPGGSTVYSNADTQRMMVGSGQPVVVNFEVGSSGNADFDKFMLQWIRKNVRVQGGGSTQKAFGFGS